MLRNKLFGTKQQQPPRAHSLEQLKTLYDALQKIDWSKSKNVQLIIESLRSLSEVLIWGDQNDPTVFDYFLEKQMLSYFVQIIQKCAPDSSSTNTITASAVVTTGQETITVSTNTSNAVNGLKSPSSTDTTTAAIQSISSSSSYNNNTLFTQDAKNDVCKQVLQLLNILFENIEHQTSLYYLLSNNHINHIIESSYDFNHDEVLAHYISMLKVLSLKLNAHTIHFFFNEQTHGFALLRQALKLFSHPESMVRIASRTVCLNVLRVDEPRARQFILDYHSDFVFSRIVHELRHHLLMKLDRLVRKFYSTTTATVAAVDHAGAGAFSSPHHRARDQLINYYEEHADYLGILNEIFNLDVSSFSTTLRLYLMNKLFIPVHLTSLSEFIATRKIPDDDDSLLHPVTAIFSIGFCYSSLHDVEFLNNLSRFMLSTNVADLTISQKNGQSFFNVFLDGFTDKKLSTNLGAENPAESENLQPSTATATGEDNIGKDKRVSDQIIAPSMLILVMPILCLLRSTACTGSSSSSRSTFADASPAVYKELFSENQAVRATLVHLISGMCQPGVQFPIACLHLAVDLLEKFMLTSTASTVAEVENNTEEQQQQQNARGRESCATLDDGQIACLEDVKEHCLLRLRTYYQPTNSFILAYESQLDALQQYNICSNNNNSNTKLFWLFVLSNGLHQTKQTTSSNSSSKAAAAAASTTASRAAHDNLLLQVQCVGGGGGNPGDNNGGEIAALRSFLLLSRLCCVIAAQSNVNINRRAIPEPGKYLDQFRLVAVAANGEADSNGFMLPVTAAALLLSKDDLIDVTKCELLSCSYSESWKPPLPSSETLAAAAGNASAGGGKLRFLVLHPQQLVLVEPSSKAGYAAVREAFPLHLCIILNEKAERSTSRSSSLLLKVLSLNFCATSADYETFIAKNAASSSSSTPEPTSPTPTATTPGSPSAKSSSSTAAATTMLTLKIDGRLKFDDHIRCLAASQKLKDRKTKLFEANLQRLAVILDLPLAMRPSSGASQKPHSKLNRVVDTRQINSSSLTSLPAELVTVSSSSSQRTMFLEKLWSAPARRRKPPGGVARLTTTTPAGTVADDAGLATSISSNSTSDIAMVYRPPVIPARASTMAEHSALSVDAPSSSDSEILTSFRSVSATEVEKLVDTSSETITAAARPTEIDFNNDNNSKYAAKLSPSAELIAAMTTNVDDSDAAALVLSSGGAEGGNLSSQSSSSVHSSPELKSSLLTTTDGTLNLNNSVSLATTEPTEKPQRPHRRTHKPGTVHHL